MTIRSDMMSFPEMGMPVLSDLSDRVALNTLYKTPLKPAALVLDIIGANRLLGALTISGALSGVTSLSMGGALSGVTTLAMSGDLGSIMARASKGWFKNLEVKYTPTVDGELVALLSDIYSHSNQVDPHTGYVLESSHNTVTIQTTTYTILSTDNLVVCNSTTAFTVTLPAASGSGKIYHIKNINSGTITLEGNSSDTIDGDLNVPIIQWDDVSVIDYAANKWVIV